MLAQKKKKKDAAAAGVAAEILQRRLGEKSAPVAKMPSAQIWDSPKCVSFDFSGLCFFLLAGS